MLICDVDVVFPFYQLDLRFKGDVCFPYIALCIILRVNGVEIDEVNFQGVVGHS